MFNEKKNKKSFPLINFLYDFFSFFILNIFFPLFFFQMSHEVKIVGGCSRSFLRCFFFRIDLSLSGYGCRNLCQLNGRFVIVIFKLREGVKKLESTIRFDTL